MSLKGFLHYDFKRYAIYLYWYVRSEPSTCEKARFLNYDTLYMQREKRKEKERKNMLLTTAIWPAITMLPW